MHPTLRRTVRAALTATVSAMLVGGAALTVGITMAPTTASAATSAAGPPWGTDPNSVGSLIFYNSAGQVITGGSISASPLAAYVQGTNTVRSGDTEAALWGFLPVQGQVPGQWSGEQLSSATGYPNLSAPKALASSSLPLVTGHASDENLETLQVDFPNTAPSTSPYYGLYQLRLYTSKKDESQSTTYDSATVQITGSNWSVAFAQAKTSVALSVSPSTAAYHSSTVKLTATVTPSAAAGSVEFRDGSKTLKTVAVKSGHANYSTTSLADGVQHLSATFVPTDTNSYLGSSSAVHKLTISPHPTTTSLKASKATITKGQRVTLTAVESPAVAGSVTFYDGKTKLATVKVSKGTASFSTTKLAVGSHFIKAVFAPSVTANDATSTSKIVKIRVNQ